MKRPSDISQNPTVQDLIQRALVEDVGPGDVTCKALISEDATGQSRIRAKEACIMAGAEVAGAVFKALDSTLNVSVLMADSECATKDEPVLEIAGKVSSILTGERTALNFLQRMSGIATLTRRFVEKAGPHGATILDTRKTTPTLRILEKYAVRCGGGENHRMGLYDRVMAKDNHLCYRDLNTASAWPETVAQLRKRYPGLLIQIEVDTIEQFTRVLEARPDWILLDNMSGDDMRKCVVFNQGRVKLEASGGVTLETVEDMAKTGVNAISVGALTHSAPAVDLSLELLPIGSVGNDIENHG